MVQMKKILNATYRNILHDKLVTKNNKICNGKNVAITYDGGSNSTYTFEKKGRYRIVIGGNTIYTMIGLPAQVENREQLKPFFPNIIKAFYALDYHEMGHILFTDMTSTTITEHPRAEYRGFFHLLFNTVEDPVEEASMAMYFTTYFPSEVNAKNFFDFLVDINFMPLAQNYEDTGDQNSFLQYILLMLRCGKSNIKENNAIWDKYENDLLPMLKDVISEPDGTERLNKCVKMGEWIIDNIPEFDWSQLSCPEEEQISGSIKNGGTPMPGMQGKSMSKQLSKSNKGNGGKPGKDEDEDEGEEAGKGNGDEEAEGDDDEPEGGTERGLGGEEEGEQTWTGREVKERKQKEQSNWEETLEGENELDDDVFDDMFGDESDHRWEIGNEAFDRGQIHDEIDDILRKNEAVSRDIAEFLNLFHGRQKPRIMEGFTRGKLNIRRAMKDDLRDGCDIKIFNQAVKRGKAADLCVNLTIDNSGSMSGTKSEIATEAALMLAQACEWSNVPFECVCFNTGSSDTPGYWGSCPTTIEIKNFNQTFEESKPFFAINNSRLIRSLDKINKVPSFTGNIDEVNLYYIANRLEKVDHETKLMFVLSDGQTCGSEATLKQVVSRIENEQNIVVIGIGICSNDVPRIYSKYKVFRDIRELEGLGAYLIDTLGQYAA